MASAQGGRSSSAQLSPAEIEARRIQRARAQGSVRWDLLRLLVSKDLKVKYQGSTAGYLWSLANPLLLLGIYWVIFTKVFKTPVPDYHVYLMAGLLAFTAFSQGVSGAAGSVVGNAGLVKKVRFPLLVLPLSAIGNSLVQLGLQMPVLLGIALVSGVNIFTPRFLLILPAIALLVLFTTALGVLVSALNVRYRDTAHFVEVGMLIWFWANPILYPAGLVRTQLERFDLYWAYFLNPMATVVSTFQAAVYQTPTYRDAQGAEQLVLADESVWFYIQNLGIGLVISCLLLLLARRVFNARQGDFAEEL